MSYQRERKVRLSVDCTEEERMYIKMLATRNRMTISEYLLSFARKEMPQCGPHLCRESHELNTETAQVLRETDKGKNLIEPETLDEFWDGLGFGKKT